MDVIDRKIPIMPLEQRHGAVASQTNETWARNSNSYISKNILTGNTSN